MPVNAWGTQMKTVAAFILAMILGANSASAEVIDLSTLTCGRLLQGTHEQRKIVLTWLDAYYRDDDEPAVIDTDKFVDNGKKLGEYCAEHPSIGVITAADQLFSK